jgi:hypothetical protein
LLGDIIFHYLILEILKPTEIVDYLLIERGRVQALPLLFSIDNPYIWE